MSFFHENFERKIRKEKLKTVLYIVSHDFKIKNNLADQAKDLVLKFVAQANSSKPWNKAKEFSEVEEQKGRKNDATLMKENRFGRQCNASLKCIDMLESLTVYLEQEKNAKMK